MSTFCKTAAIAAAGMLSVSSASAATYSIDAVATGQMDLNLGFAQVQELVFVDPDDGTEYFDEFLVGGNEIVTVNGVYNATNSIRENIQASSVINSTTGEALGNIEDAISITLTNTHATATVEQLMLDVYGVISMSGSLSSSLIGYTQIDANATVSGGGLPTTFASIFEETNCTAAIAPCDLFGGEFAQGSNQIFFNLAAGESRSFTLSVSASTNAIVPTVTVAPVPLPASALLLGTALLGLARRRKTAV